MPLGSKDVVQGSRKDHGNRMNPEDTVGHPGNRTSRADHEEEEGEEDAHSQRSAQDREEGEGDLPFPIFPHDEESTHGEEVGEGQRRRGQRHPIDPDACEQWHAWRRLLLRNPG